MTDSLRRVSHEVDVAVIGAMDGERVPLLVQGRYDTRGTSLVCFSAVGFSDELVAAATQNADVRLVGLGVLYSDV